MNIYIIVSEKFSNAHEAFEFGKKVKRKNTVWYLSKRSDGYFVLREPVAETQDKYLPGNFITIEDSAKLLPIN
jgi:hypothetical protein